MHTIDHLDSIISIEVYFHHTSNNRQKSTLSCHNKNANTKNQQQYEMIIAGAAEI